MQKALSASLPAFPKYGFSQGSNTEHRMCVFNCLLFKKITGLKFDLVGEITWDLSRFLLLSNRHFKRRRWLAAAEGAAATIKAEAAVIVSVCVLE